MLDQKTTAVPQPDRPYIPNYGIPESIEGVLAWDFVVERMAKARNYWVGTVSPEGRPHAVPVWGVWLEGVLYFGGGPDTRWSRNLAANPAVTVHLESGDEVVIIEGHVERITDPDHPLVAEVDAAYLAKYEMPHGTPFWILKPELVFAWSDFPQTTTRWRFTKTL